MKKKEERQMHRNNEVRVNRLGDLFQKRFGMFVLDTIYVSLLFLNNDTPIRDTPI